MVSWFRRQLLALWRTYARKRRARMLSATSRYPESDPWESAGRLPTVPTRPAKRGWHLPRMRSGPEGDMTYKAGHIGLWERPQ